MPECRCGKKMQIANIPSLPDERDTYAYAFVIYPGRRELAAFSLAMVHGFVKQSGGHVRVYSEVDEGTTVKIYLPRLRQTEERATPIHLSPETTASPRAQGAERILLVEDNASVREFTRLALEELGYSVVESGDAVSALRVVMSATHLDLLFTDVVLQGGTNGRELAREVLEHRPNLPVLFTTGYSRNAIVHQGRLDDDVYLLVKPYTQQDLPGKSGLCSMPIEGKPPRTSLISEPKDDRWAKPRQKRAEAKAVERFAEIVTMRRQLCDEHVAAMNQATHLEDAMLRRLSKRRLAALGGRYFSPR